MPTPPSETTSLQLDLSGDLIKQIVASARSAQKPLVTSSLERQLYLTQLTCEVFGWSEAQALIEYIREDLKLNSPGSEKVVPIKRKS